MFMFAAAMLLRCWASSRMDSFRRSPRAAPFHTSLDQWTDFSLGWRTGWAPSTGRLAKAVSP